MPAFVTLDTVSFVSPDGRALFENLTLALGSERTGLVGRNGVGKTTLMRLILGELEPAAGTVTRNGRVAILRQALSPPADAALVDLLDAREGLRRLDRLEAGTGEGDDLDLADWTLAQRLEASLAQVGLAGIALDRPATTLSGGELTRAALARLVTAEPDFILLDEPTNNLDAEARSAVGELLESWRGGALVVSHDRALLRRMDRIVELTSLAAKIYGGDYDLYAARKAEEEATAARDLERAEQTLDRTARDIQLARERKQQRDAAGKRSRTKGDAPKMALDFSAERAEATGARDSKLADRMRVAAERDLADAQARIERVRRLAFDLPPSGMPAGRIALAFEAVSFAWPDGSPVLRDFSLRLTGPERVAVTGPNGSGKTTLIRLATGDLEPDRGAVRRPVSAVLLDQRASVLRDEETLLENFRRLNPEADDNAAHAALARFVFRNVAALKPASSLSGGERLRAALACVLMAARPPQLIILDEPSNHLDLESLAAVEAALAAYDGALLVVSHDRDFLEAVGVEREIELRPCGSA